MKVHLEGQDDCPAHPFTGLPGGALPRSPHPRMSSPTSLPVLPTPAACPCVLLPLSTPQAALQGNVTLLLIRALQGLAHSLCQPPRPASSPARHTRLSSPPVLAPTLLPGSHAHMYESSGPASGPSLPLPQAPRPLRALCAPGGGSGLSFAAPVPQFVITGMVVWLPLGSVSLGPWLSPQRSAHKRISTKVC